MADPVVHFEIGCRDLAATKSFYAQMFDWKIGGDSMIAPGPNGIGGHLVALGHEPHNYTLVYIQVEDLDASLAKAQALGGKKVLGPIQIPLGTFAWIADPEGNHIGLWKPA